MHKESVKFDVAVLFRESSSTVHILHNMPTFVNKKITISKLRKIQVCFSVLRLADF
jgi:hypothetical protein